MITGFNTDVEHDGITYHVQTEDKGLETPLLLSLVYTGGEILASKRVRYDDLIAEGFDEKVLADRLQRQHKLICAAIRSGRLDDLRKMSERESATRTAAKKESAKESHKETEQVTPTQTAPAPTPSAPSTLPASPPTHVESQVESAAPVTPDEPHPITLDEQHPITLDEPHPIVPPPPPPVSIPAMLKKSGGRRTPAVRNSKRLPPPPAAATQSRRGASQKSVADFARAEAPTGDALRLSLIDEKVYRGGEHIILRAHVGHGIESREPSGGAEVIVKILGSTFRPLILQSKTGPDGVATFSIQLPHFRSGRAAILIRATIGSYEAELRRIIQQG